MDFHKTNLGIKYPDSYEGDFAIREFEIFLFQDLLIWKFIYIKIHIVLVYYRLLIVKFNWFNLEQMVSESIKCTLHDTVTCPRPREEKFDPPKIEEYPDKGRPPSAVIWNLIEDLGIYRTFLSANGRQASVGNDGT